FARKLACLFDPARELFAELIPLMDMVIAHRRVFGRLLWRRVEIGAAEERDFHITIKTVEREEPAVLLQPVERGVPLNGFANAGDLLANDGIDLQTGSVLPTTWPRVRHGIQPGFDRLFAVTHRDLRIPSRKKLRLGHLTRTCLSLAHHERWKSSASIVDVLRFAFALGAGEFLELLLGHGFVHVFRRAF